MDLFFCRKCLKVFEKSGDLEDKIYYLKYQIFYIYFEV